MQKLREGRAYTLAPSSGTLRSAVLLVLHAGCLAGEVAQVEEAAAADDAARNDLDLLEARGVQHENALHPDVEAHLADRERRAQAGAVALDDDAPEDLDAELVALDDLVVDGDGVANPEVRDILADSARLQRVNFGQRRGHGGARLVGGARDYALEHR